MIAQRLPQLPPIMFIDVEDYRSTMPGVSVFAAPDWMQVYDQPIRREQVAVMPAPSAWKHAATIRPQTALEMLDANPDAAIFVKPSSRHAQPHVQVISLLQIGKNFLAVCMAASRVITFTFAPDRALITYQ